MLHYEKKRFVGAHSVKHLLHKLKFYLFNNVVYLKRLPSCTYPKAISRYIQSKRHEISGYGFIKKKSNIFIEKLYTCIKLVQQQHTRHKITQHNVIWLFSQHKHTLLSVSLVHSISLFTQKILF